MENKLNNISSQYFTDITIKGNIFRVSGLNKRVNKYMNSPSLRARLMEALTISPPVTTLFDFLLRLLRRN